MLGEWVEDVEALPRCPTGLGSPTILGTVDGRSMRQWGEYTGGIDAVVRVRIAFRNENILGPPSIAVWRCLVHMFLRQFQDALCDTSFVDKGMENNGGPHVRRGCKSGPRSA
jgi:hypothetical protein